MVRFAMLLNVGLLGLTFWMFSKYGIGNADDETLPLMAMMLLAPSASLVALVRGHTGTRGWLSLWLERKALEERAKITALKSADSN